MKKLTRNQETMVNLGSNLLSMLISLIMSFLLTPFIIEHLGEEANGFNQLASNFVTYASLIATTLNFMGARFMAVEYHKGDLLNANRYYSSLAIGNALIISVLFIIGSVCVYNLESIVNIDTADPEDVKILFAFVFGTYGLSLVNSVFSTAIFIKNKLIYTNLIAIVIHLLRFGTVLTLFYTLEPHIFYVSMVDFVLTAVSVTAHIILKKKLFPDVRFRKENFRLQHIKTLMVSGIWDTVNQCGNILMSGMDLLLTNLFISPLEMGVLSVAKMVPTNVMRLGKMVNRNFSPNLTITYAKNGTRDVLKNLRWAIKISSVIMSIPVSVFLIYGREFYGLWVPGLDAMKLNILSFLSCMNYVFLSGTSVLYNVFTTTNKLKVNSISVVISGFVNFICVYFLLKFTELGVFAIAGTSSVIWVLREAIVTLPYCAKILECKWYEFYKDILISFACFASVTAVSAAVSFLIPGTGWVIMFSKVGLSCLVGLAAELLILLTKDEKKRLLKRFLK